MPRAAVPCRICGKPCNPSRTSGASPAHRACVSSEPVQCGTRRAYRQRGCRCEKCRAEMARQVRQYAADYQARTGEWLWGKYKRGGDTTRHGNAVPRAVRLAVYERDEWTCQLCDGPVDRTLSPNDRMAATLDHIKFQSSSLEPDHSVENLRLAHRACNSRRGNRVAA